MRVTRSTSAYPHPYTDQALYADLSQTMLQRKNLSTITKPLRNHQITYKWDHPVKLVVTKDNKSYNIRSVDEGISWLYQWKILDPVKQPQRNRYGRNQHS